MKVGTQAYAPYMREEVLNLKLRLADELEVKASGGYKPKEAIKVSLKASQAVWVIKVDGKIVGVFGVTINGNLGIPWLLGSEVLDTIKLSFIKGSRAVLRLLVFLDTLDCLSNYVSVQNKSSIRWLEWLGFELLEPEVYLRDPEVPFKQFVKWRTDKDV